MITAFIPAPELAAQALPIALFVVGAAVFALGTWLRE